MRISEWSSDVCSSDLVGRGHVFRNIGDRLHRPAVVAEHGDRLAAVLASGDALVFVEHVEAGRQHAVDGAEYFAAGMGQDRSEEHTSELQSLMSSSYAVFCLKNKTTLTTHTTTNRD